MTFIGQRFEINERLSGVLSHLYTIQVPEGTPSQLHHLSPSLEMMVVFNFGEPVCFSFGDEEICEHTIERIGILGPLRQMMNYKLTEGADLLILPFIYDGFYRFLGIAMDRADVNGITEADITVQTQHLENVWKMLSSITAPEKRINALTDHLLKTVTHNDPAALVLLEGVPDIHNPSVNPVKIMADRADITERTVQLRFKKYVGYSSKELLRFLRFKQVMIYILSHPQEKINWFELIVQYK